MEIIQESYTALLLLLGQLPQSTLLMPLIGAVIGWSTNYLAVKMLFHPRKEINLLLCRVQGVFPKRQKEFARKLGSVVSTELISVSDITDKLVAKASSKEILNLVADKIEKVMVERIPTIFPMASMFIGPEVISSVKTSFMGELETLIEQIVKTLSAHVEDEVDVYQLVEEKVSNFSTEKLEDIVFAIMKREFRFIEFVGAVVGFFIGVAQLMLLVVTTPS